MRIIAIKTLREFGENHADAKGPLETWYQDVKAAKWSNTQDIKTNYASASFLEGDRVVFNIKGNKYRLVVAVKYTASICFIRFIGTHAEYDKIDAKTV